MSKKVLKKAIFLVLGAFLLCGLVACNTNVYKYENRTADVTLSRDITYESFAEASYDERTEILGLLEKYAVENNLTGLTIFGNGSFAMYHPRIVKGTDTYIPGYGFGISKEGSITADLESETVAAWKRYLHTFQTDDPKTVNYMNDKGSVVGDLTALVHSGYWTTVMNSTKDGYEWVNNLANTKPVALNANTNGFATKYRWEVKVGSEMQYNTLTKDSALAAYAGRNIALEDYLTPFKELHNQSNGLARGAENLTGANSIKGMQNYYNSTADGFNQAAWDQVGLKAYAEGGKSYVEVEFNNAVNGFYAMYYMSSSLYSPIPADFLTAIGGIKNYGSYVNASPRTPVDTTLATNIYVLEHWEDDKQIVFKRNDKYQPNSSKYQIAGYHYTILSAQKTDPEAAFKEFLAGKLDSVAIPSTKLQEYKSDPRTTQTTADSNFKLNINSCTPERWEELFGVNGTIAQTAKKDYWDVKPIMSNADFLKGISLSINRRELADKTGRTAAFDYFAPNYLSNPEAGVSYGTTQAHKNAVASLLPEGTDDYGYSLELAKYYFKKAADALIKDGSYKANDVVEIEIVWQTQANIDQYGSVAKYIEDAFNASGAKITLKVNQEFPAVWSDVYYQKMMIGQFDIGFGSISGNALNPLNFLETLKSDNSSGFTLNWGPDTSKADPTLTYKGKVWSFDALWQASDSEAYVANGEIVKVYDAVLKSSILKSDGTRVVTIIHDTLDLEDYKATLKKIVVGYYEGDEAYEEEMEIEVNGKTITFTMSQELLERFAGPISINLYFDVTVRGETTEDEVITINSRTTVLK